MVRFGSIKKQKNHAVFSFLFFKMKFKIKLRKKYTSRAVVLLGTVGIGDYILYRPFFKYIKKSPKYKNSSIIYIGRNIYNDFVNLYDIEYFDDVIDYDLDKLDNYFYKKSLIKKINSYNPDLFFSLTPVGGKKRPKGIIGNIISIYKHVKAKEKCISCFNDKIINKKDFNKVIKNHCEEGFQFESERIRKEFAKLLEMEIPQEKSCLKSLLENKKRYIALAPFSSSSDRMIPITKWIEIIDYIILNTDPDTKIILLGTKKERNIAQFILSSIENKQRYIDLTGRLNICAVPSVLKSCDFLIGVESGNIHIAHAAGCRAICLAGSGSYGRFHPYKDNIVEYIYPDEFQKIIDKNSIQPDKFENLCIDKKYSVKKIDIEKVKRTIDRFLNIQK